MQAAGSVTQKTQTLYNLLNGINIAGNTCGQAIFDFLQSPNSPLNLQELTALGLSPEQVRQELTEVSFKCFLECLALIKKSNDPQANFYSLLQYYPTVAERILQKTADDQMTRESQTLGPQRNQVILEKLKAHVVDHEQAVTLLSSHLADQENKPSAKGNNLVLLFVGPSGIGKTELAKAVAKIKNDRFTSFAMANYASEYALASLFGSPIGIVGSNDKPGFFQSLEKFSTFKGLVNSEERYDVENTVLLFDEFENAHSAVKQAFLNLFDEGYCNSQYTQDAQGNNTKNITLKQTFRNCVMICTSNLFQGEILEGFKRRMRIETIGELFAYANQHTQDQNVLAKRFTPQLLNRIKAIPFGPISRGPLYQSIINMKLPGLVDSLKSKGFFEIEFRDKQSVIERLEYGLYGDGTNIRRMGQYFDAIVVSIDQKMQGHGDPKTKKITFLTENQNIFIEISILVDMDFGKFHHVVEKFSVPFFPATPGSLAFERILLRPFNGIYPDNEASS